MSDLDDLQAALVTGGIARVYKLGEVPHKPTYPYAVLSSAPNAPQVRTLDGSGDPVGRFIAQHFGRTADSVQTLADITFATFDGKALPLTGEPVAAQEIATPPFRDADDQGVLSITHTYRY